VKHAASAIAVGTEKLRTRVSPVEDFITSKLDPLVAINHDPALRRLDLHRQPLAGPA
jgi:hypothetical protein